MKLTAHSFHLTVLDLLEEPFRLQAGFHTSDLFFTDDNGTYYFPTRDFHPPSEDYRGKQEQLENHLIPHRKRIRKLSDKRLYIPKESPFMDPHNTWIANHEGSTLFLPVADLAQHMLSVIWYYALDKRIIYDDIAKKPIPGVEKFPDVIANPNNMVPSFFRRDDGSGRMLSRDFNVMLCRSINASGDGTWRLDI